MLTRAKAREAQMDRDENAPDDDTRREATKGEARNTGAKAAATGEQTGTAELAAILEYMQRRDEARMENERNRQREQLERWVRERERLLEERRREAEAAERRERQLQEMLKSFKETPPPKQRVKDLKIAPLRNDEDIERYLTSFERIAAACDWEKST